MILHVMLCVVLILIILLQPGKDSADIFGGGQSGNRMYGARSQANPLGRATTVIAVLFMFTSITLAFYSADSVQSGSEVMDDIKKLEAELTKEDLEFQVPKLPGLNASTLMKEVPKPPEEEAPLEEGGEIPPPGDNPEAEDLTVPTEGNK
jgi:preprotein translocase subunit SecG